MTQPDRQPPIINAPWPVAIFAILMVAAHLIRILLPDPFQNAGKRVPERPDWSDLRMLTILDIGGFLGAPAVDCTWRIESLRGLEGTR